MVELTLIQITFFFYQLHNKTKSSIQILSYTAQKAYKILQTLSPALAKADSGREIKQVTKQLLENCPNVQLKKGPFRNFKNPAT